MATSPQALPIYRGRRPAYGNQPKRTLPTIRSAPQSPDSTPDLPVYGRRVLPQTQTPPTGDYRLTSDDAELAARQQRPPDHLPVMQSWLPTIQNPLPAPTRTSVRRR
jgi:hypothetical protein